MCVQYVWFSTVHLLLGGCSGNMPNQVSAERFWFCQDKGLKPLLSSVFWLYFCAVCGSSSCKCWGTTLILSQGLLISLKSQNVNENIFWIVIYAQIIFVCAQTWIPIKEMMNIIVRLMPVIHRICFLLQICIVVDEHHSRNARSCYIPGLNSVIKIYYTYSCKLKVDHGREIERCR